MSMGKETLSDLQARELQFQILTVPEYNLPFRSTFPQEQFLRKKGYFKLA